jgi:hypothetical protein
MFVLSLGRRRMFFERLEVSEVYRSLASLTARLRFVDERRPRRFKGHARGSWILGDGHDRFDWPAMVLEPDRGRASWAFA